MMNIDMTPELNEARNMQMSMLPQTVPQIPGFQLAAYSNPAIAELERLVGRLTLELEAAKKISSYFS